MTTKQPRIAELADVTPGPAIQNMQRRMGGSNWYNLVKGQWKELYHHLTSPVPPQFDNLSISIGLATEELNLELLADATELDIELNTHTSEFGPFRSTPDVIIHDKTMDVTIIADAKFTSKKSMNDMVESYKAQLHHNAAFVNADKMILSVINGSKPSFEYTWLDWDPVYWKFMLEQWHLFCHYLSEGIEPPEQVSDIEAPEPWRPSKVEDMTRSNMWAVAAADFLKHEEPARRFNSAKSSLKEMMTAEHLRMHGHGVEVQRSKNGNLLVRREK